MLVLLVKEVSEDGTAKTIFASADEVVLRKISRIVARRIDDIADRAALEKLFDGFEWRAAMMKTKIEPMALQIRKRGRVCTVAKITVFVGDDRPVLAMVWRNQHGTSEAISLPPAAIEYAKALGVTDFYLRDDRAGQMYTCPLEEFEKRGWIGPDGERYIRLAALRHVPWRQWQYAEKTVLLDSIEHEQETTNSRVCQLELGV